MPKPVFCKFQANKRKIITRHNTKKKKIEKK